MRRVPGPDLRPGHAALRRQAETVCRRSKPLTTDQKGRLNGRFGAWYRPPASVWTKNPSSGAVSGHCVPATGAVLEVEPRDQDTGEAGLNPVASDLCRPTAFRTCRVKDHYAPKRSSVRAFIPPVVAYRTGRTIPAIQTPRVASRLAA